MEEIFYSVMQNFFKLLSIFKNGIVLQKHIQGI